MKLSNPRLVLASALAALCSGPAAGNAARVEREPALLLGGASSPHPSPVAIDPWLPTGSLRNRLERPDTRSPAGCSTRHPVCVHADGASDEAAGAALSALERAYERLVWVLELPPPLPDRGLGGNDGLDWYVGRAASPLSTGHDAPELGLWDAAPAFCVGGDGEDLERAATRCVAEAIAWRLDAAETPEARAAYGTLAWWITGEPRARDLEIVDDAQARPERASSSAMSAPLWWAYLDGQLSTLAPARLASALFGASVGRTAPDAWRWDNEPDSYDVLRHTLDDGVNRFAALLADFGVRRAFLGSRDDGVHWPSLGWTGSFGRVRYDWVIPYSTLPRRVAASRPIEPTGSVYVWLDLDRDPGTAPLGFQAEWEPPVSFVWTLVKLARDGRELGRLTVPYQQRATSAEQQLNELAGAAAVLVIGTNVGGVDLAHPFDPDWTPFEPSGCTVYLTKL